MFRSNGSAEKRADTDSPMLIVAIVKILAIWTALSVFLSFLVAPALARRLRKYSRRSDYDCSDFTYVCLQKKMTGNAKHTIPTALHRGGRSSPH
jgi:hypothetical protein